MSRFVAVHAIQVDLQTQFECFGQEMHVHPAWLRCLVSGDGMVLWYDLMAGNPNSRRLVGCPSIVNSGAGCIIDGKGCSFLSKYFMFLRRQNFKAESYSRTHFFIDHLLYTFYEWPVGMHGMRAGLFKGTPLELSHATARTIHVLNSEVAAACKSCC